MRGQNRPAQAPPRQRVSSQPTRCPVFSVTGSGHHSQVSCLLAGPGAQVPQRRALWGEEKQQGMWEVAGASPSICKPWATACEGILGGEGTVFCNFLPRLLQLNWLQKI